MLQGLSAPSPSAPALPRALVTACAVLLVGFAGSWLAACKATVPGGVFACDEDADCPRDFVCRADPDSGEGYCFAPGGDGSRPGGDAGVQLDGGTGDGDGDLGDGDLGDGDVGDGDAPPGDGDGDGDAGDARTGAGGGDGDAGTAGTGTGDGDGDTGDGDGDGDTGDGDGDGDSTDPCSIDNGGCDPRVECSAGTDGPRCDPCPVGYTGDPSVACELLSTVQFGSSVLENALGAVTNADGDLFIVGYTEGSLGEASKIGMQDAFLVKYDAGGTQAWLEQFGTTANDIAWGIAMDTAGDVYVVGFTAGALHGQDHLGGSDFFVAKYRAGGTRVWTTQFGTDQYDIGSGIVVSGNDIYITGRTGGELPGETSSGDYDFVVARIATSDGELQWAKQHGSDNRDEGHTIDLDSSGNIYVGGFTVGELDGNGKSGDLDAAVLKFDGSGVWQWSRVLGTGGEDRIGTVISDGSGVYAVGKAAGNVAGVTGQGGTDELVAYYDAGGTRQWLRLTGTSAYDDATAAVIDGDGDLYVAGATEGSLPGFENRGDMDVRVTKYSGSGAELWSRQIGTENKDEGRSIALDPAGGVIVPANMEESVDGQPFQGVRDVVVLRYGTDGAQR